MARKIKVLSLAVGETDPPTAQWKRIIQVANCVNRENILRFTSFARTHFSSVNPDIADYHRESIGSFGHKMVTGMRKHLLDFDPQVVYANTHLTASLAGLLKRVSLPMIFDMHGFAAAEWRMMRSEEGILSNLRHVFANQIAENLSLRRTAKVACVSLHMMNYLYRKKNIPRNRLHYITNGVDLERYQPRRNNEIDQLKRELGFESKLVFGYMGNFQTWQGTDQLVNAALSNQDQHLGFLFVGGKESWTKGNVRMVKKVPENELPNLYGICDVLVLPRPRQLATIIAAPTKFAEYAAMGKPILTTEVGDASYFVRSNNCGLVQPSNSITHLLEGFDQFKEKSESDLKEMGQNARNFAERQFHWDRIGAKIQEMILEAIE